MAWVSVVTVRGAFNYLSQRFGGGVSASTGYELRLFTSDVIPTKTTTNVGGLTEVSTGSTTGYAPISLANNSTNFPMTEGSTSAFFDIPDHQIVGGSGGFTFRVIGLVTTASSDLEQYWVEDTVDITINPSQPLDLVDLIGRVQPST